MAKRRLLTTSLSERYLGSYGHSNGGGNGTDASEFREEEVWSIVDDDRYGGGVGRDWNSSPGSQSNGGVTGRGPRIPDRDRRSGGLSLALEDTKSFRIVHQLRAQENGGASTPRRLHHMAASAPVSVPGWNSIHRVEPMDDSDNGFDDQASGMDPPHEYLERSRRMAAASVFEGVGRTLKGLDMSRLRDAVWSQTGFDG
ncbi:hypothetical protein Nepgr_021296 [Nepenthes gracilis]|uniref:Senescence regulator n=1 Tax=Nepenthes gracilis TaxID=150966 RepID=A0AAD3XX33_NEPGR|nr:hypothetical protein Nepgr_021296 [Nepenthes gracilis]